jgi:hypothetical protein
MTGELEILDEEREEATPTTPDPPPARPAGHDPLVLIWRCDETGLERQALPPVVARIARLFDGSRSLAAVCEQSALSLDKGRAVVSRLSAMGILLATDPVSETSQAPADLGGPFSPIEEDFFSAEVVDDDPWDERAAPRESFFSRLRHRWPRRKPP